MKLIVLQDNNLLYDWILPASSTFSKPYQAAVFSAKWLTDLATIAVKKSRII